MRIFKKKFKIKKEKKMNKWMLNTHSSFQLKSKKKWRKKESLWKKKTKEMSSPCN